MQPWPILTRAAVAFPGFLQGPKVGLYLELEDKGILSSGVFIHVVWRCSPPWMDFKRFNGKGVIVVLIWRVLGEG